MKRRTFLKNSLYSSTLLFGVGSGLLRPGSALAAWPEAAFQRNRFPKALEQLVGSTKPIPSDQISIEAPDFVGNGAVVQIAASTTLPGAESIAIMVESNPIPLTAIIELTPKVEAYIATRIKIQKQSRVFAIVKADGRYYSAFTTVDVTFGGCTQ